MRKRLINAMLSCMLISSMVAPVASCGTRGQFGETVDKKKTQLFVSNYDGGFGTVWLNDLKTAFEAENALDRYTHSYLAFLNEQAGIIEKTRFCSENFKCV